MAYPVKFEMTRDINGYNGFGLPFTGVNYSTILVATVEQNFTVPFEAEQWLAIFSFEPGDPVWCAVNDTAAIPGAAFAQTTSQQLPVARKVKRGDILSFITSGASVEMGVSLYALQ